VPSKTDFFIQSLRQTTDARMERLSSLTCLGSVIRFFTCRLGSRSRNNRRTGISATSSSDSIRPGVQAVFPDIDKPGVFGDMPHGAYRIRMPSMEGVHGVRAWVPKTKPRAHLKDFLSAILPETVEDNVEVFLPDRPKTWSRQERSWKYDFLTPEDEFVMKLDDKPWKAANREAWQDWREKYECGKGQDKRKRSNWRQPRRPKQVPLKWRVAKDWRDMNVHPRVWILRNEKRRAW
jgi:hypothetical protein